MIVPQTFKKVLLTKEGTIKTERFTVSGRKIPLPEIRTRMLKSINHWVYYEFKVMTTILP